jgi:O-antigen ligase
MIARADAPIPISPRMVAAAGLGAAFVCGALIGRGPATGIGFLALLFYAPLVLLNLPLALALWVVITFVKYLPVVSIGPNAASLLVLVGWAGAAAGRRRQVRAALRAQVLPALGGVLVAWLSLSGLWADSVADSFGKLWEWAVAVLVLVVVAGTVRTRRHVELVMAGFVAGAVLSVTIGLVANGLAGASSAYETATATEGRLQGGSGDPNYLAAGIVAAIAVAGGLLQVWRDALARLALWISLLVLVVGLVATQSRGGLIAAVVATGVAIVVNKHRRGALLGAVALLLAAGAVWLAANPAAVERFTTTDQGGNGRSELWSVAWAMGTDRPLTGVGLNNFRERSPDYVSQIGGLQFVELISERPHVVHNTYLQAFAETGLIGLGLLLAVFVSALLSARAAAHRFFAAGDARAAELARAVLVALAGAMTASFFLSNGEDGRTWLLMGLALGLLAISRGREA